MADETINIKVLLDTANSAKSIQETRKAIKDLTSAALQVGEGTSEFQQLTQAAGELKDKVDDTRGAVKFFSDDMKNLNGAISIAKGIAAGFEVAQASIALFGAENKNVEKALLKVQSAMALLNGVMAIQEVLQKTSKASLFITNTLRTIAIRLTSEQAVATAKEAVATNTATLSQKALNAAMNANPIGILVTVILAAVTAMTLFSDTSEEAAKKQEDYNDELARSIVVNDDLSKSYLSLKNAKIEASVIVLEKQLQEEKNLSKQKELVDQITEAKKKQLDIDLELAILEGEFGNQAKEVQKQIAINTRLTSEFNKLEKERFDAAGTGLANLSNDEEKYYQIRKDIITQGGTATKKQQEEINKLNLKRFDDNTLLYTQIGGLAKQSVTDEQESYKKRLETNKKFTDKTKINYSDVNKFLTTLDNKKAELNQKISNDKIKLDIDSETKKKKLEEEADAKAKKLADDRRKRLLEEINDKLARTKDANGKLLKLTADNIDDIKEKELALQEITYGDQKNALMEASIKIQLKRNEDAFVARLINQKTFEDNKAKLEAKGYAGLNDAEKKLYDFYVANNQKIIKVITDRYNIEAEISKSKTAEINAERISLETSYAKELELLRANEIQDETKKAETILDINSRYRIKEKEERANLLAAQEESLSIEYVKILENKSLTDEQLLKLEAQYQLDLAKLRGDAAAKEASDNAVVFNSTQKLLDDKKQMWVNFYQQLGNEILNLISTIDANITAGNVSVVESRKANALKSFDEEYQAYQDMTDHKTNAEQAKFDKEKEFADKKAAIEAEYDKQKRDIEYEAAVRAWEYSMASATINLAGGILKSLEQGGPLLAAAAGILGGVQLATIMANPPEKYATGGLIKGEGTGTSDSINTMLSNGESVINAKSTAMFLPMLDMINQAGGGAPLMNGGIKMATGGVVNNINNNQVDTTRIEQVLEAYLSRPIKTYVTSSDVTNGQRSDDRLKSRTSF
jgi:hypothetical protein